MVNQSTVLNKDNKQIGIQGRNAFVSKMPILDKIFLSAGITAEMVGFAAVGSAAPIMNRDNSFWINLGETLKTVKITPDILMIGGTALVVLGGVMLIKGVKYITDIKSE